MNFHQLREHVDAIAAAMSEVTVHYGCDCGCGGEYWAENPEAWDDLWKGAEKSKEALAAFGVTFEVTYFENES